MDFVFMGGSMGSVVGEKVARLFERARRASAAPCSSPASGGARMQEGILSLMQMAKTCAALDRFRERAVHLGPAAPDDRRRGSLVRVPRRRRSSPSPTRSSASPAPASSSRRSARSCRRASSAASSSSSTAWSTRSFSARRCAARSGLLRLTPSRAAPGVAWLRPVFTAVAHGKRERQEAASRTSRGSTLRTSRWGSIGCSLALESPRQSAEAVSGASCRPAPTGRARRAPSPPRV